MTTFLKNLLIRIKEWINQPSYEYMDESWLKKLAGERTDE
jgi:hypothetical protein